MRQLSLWMIGLGLIGGCAVIEPGRSAWDAPAAAPFPGFEQSPHFGEWIRDSRFDPGVRIHVNLAADHDPDRPSQVVFFATPNGNSIEQTIGREMTEGLDWHFDIQHIGAQTRRLREIADDRNIVVAYLEPDTRSWPAWRRAHENSSALIARIFEQAFPEGGPDQTWVLTGHSGGGSLTFGFLNGVEQIPDCVTRIAFLDSNYAYDDDEGHGDKLLEWLRRDPENTLVAVAYDDRHITFEGRRVVSETGGTFRATTERMMRRFRDELEFTGWIENDFTCWRAMDGQVDIRVHPNPENAILHTVLVGEMNGFIHALTVGTRFESESGTLARERAYEDRIQSGE